MRVPPELARRILSLLFTKHHRSPVLALKLFCCLRSVNIVFKAHAHQVYATGVHFLASKLVSRLVQEVASLGKTSALCAQLEGLSISGLLAETSLLRLHLGRARAPDVQLATTTASVINAVLPHCASLRRLTIFLPRRGLDMSAVQLELAPCLELVSLIGLHAPANLDFDRSTTLRKVGLQGSCIPLGGLHRLGFSNYQSAGSVAFCRSKQAGLDEEVGEAKGHWTEWTTCEYGGECPRCKDNKDQVARTSLRKS